MAGVPVGTMYRSGINGNSSLFFAEVACGKLLPEDDIERMWDDCGQQPAD
ncbi:MAG: hypothetical protein K8S27_07330 [Candidatus Omnitrophica bacterium]|nr:hypothetical protein [Candidatus Omnitrophota bacterium]